MRERGLKLGAAIGNMTIEGSLSMRERGLKQAEVNAADRLKESLSMRERGLKRVVREVGGNLCRRSPCESVD